MLSGKGDSVRKIETSPSVMKCIRKLSRSPSDTTHTHLYTAVEVPKIAIEGDVKAYFRRVSVTPESTIIVNGREALRPRYVVRRGIMTKWDDFLFLFVGLGACISIHVSFMVNPGRSEVSTC